MLKEIYYSAKPAGNNAEVLSYEYRRLLQINLLGFLNSIQVATGLNIATIIQKYENLDLSQKFSPAIFNLFAKLSNCAEGGEVSKIIDVLHQLNLLNEEEIYNSTLSLSTILTENWEHEFVEKLRREHIQSHSGVKTLMLPILSPQIFHFQRELLEFKEKLQLIDHDFYKEFESYVSRVKIFNGKSLKAATSAAVFGAIYIKFPPDNEIFESYFAEHLIHETSHLHLDILLAFDELILNNNVEKYPAPIRLDKRPMFGVFHATFVLSRLVRMFQRYVKISPDPTNIEKLEKFRRQFNKGLETIEKHAILTENGRKIKSSLVEAAEI